MNNKNPKRKIFIILLLVSNLTFSQVGIGTTSPDESTALEVSAIDKGVLLPQIDLQSATDAATIANPVKSLLVWNTGTTWGDSAYYYNSGTAAAPVWSKLQSSSYETGIAKFYNNTVQTSVANGTNVTLNTTEANTISSYVTMTAGVITLQPGTYELTGSTGGIITTTSTGDARIWNGFYNITTGNYIGHGGVSQSGNAQNHYGAPHNAAHAVITVTTATEIALRIDRRINTTQISHGSDFLTSSLGRAWVSVKKFN